MINLVSVSGGKDSTATLLLAIERKTPNLRAVFADTGNEHELTYQHIEYLSENVWPIETVKADFMRNIEVRKKNLHKRWSKSGISEDRIQSVLTKLKATGNPFLDLCVLRGRFPSTFRRFCTQELKVFPIEKQIVIPLLKQGEDVTSWQGVRADESASRAKLPEQEWVDPGLLVYRPILQWTAKRVFEYHKKHKVKPNPLYLLGMGRVGCMPCIMAKKSEINEIATRFPDHIDKIEHWEKLVGDTSKRGTSSFFPLDKTPDGRAMDGWNVGIPVRVVEEWAKTDRGGAQYMIDFDEDVPQCSSHYGLCE